MSFNMIQTDQSWEAFFRDAWGRRLAVLSVEEQVERPTLEDGMALLAAILSRQQYKMSIDGKAILNPDLPPHQPFQTSEDLISLLNNMLIAFDGEEITISAHNLQSLSSDLFFKIRAFLAPITDRLGLPSGGINTFTIAGKYKSTSVGVHCDPCDIFLFPLFGRKTIYGWETSKFIQRITDIDVFEKDGAVLAEEPYERHLDCAQRVQAGPGEVIYIPAKYWHINVLDMVEPSIAIGVSLFSNRSAGELVTPVLSYAVKDEKYLNAFKSFALPQIGIGESIGKVEHVEGAEGFIQNLRKSLTLNLMQRASACGFVTGTPHDDESPAPTTGTWRLRDAYSAIHSLADEDLDGDHMYLAVNGALCRTDRSLVLESIIKCLNSGESVSMASHIADGDEVSNFMSFLLRSKAIVEVCQKVGHS